MPIKTTIEDLSKKLHISKSTVARALKNQYGVKESTRNIVLEAARALNYGPVNNNGKQSQAQTIGIVIQDGAMTNEFYNRAIVATGMFLNTYQHNIAVYTETQIRTLIGSGQPGVACSGLIIFCPEFNWEKELTLLRQQGLPCVLIRRNTRVKGITCITNDDRAGVTMIVDHLRGLGHERIGFIDTGVYQEVAQRKRYFIEYSGQAAADASAFSLSTSDEADWKAWLAEMARRPDRPTAFLCSDDYTAFRTIQQFQQQGLKIPQEVAIVGFDNANLSRYVTPKLTTVEIPVEAMCETACRLLMGQPAEASSPAPGMEIHFDLELIIRESCGYHLKKRQPGNG